MWRTGVVDDIVYLGAVLPAMVLDTLLVSDAIQNEHLDASAASVWLKTQDSADDPAHSRVL